MRVGQAEHRGRERSPRADATLERMRRPAPMVTATETADVAPRGGAPGLRAASRRPHRHRRPGARRPSDSSRPASGSPRTSVTLRTRRRRGADEARFVVAPAGAGAGDPSASARPRDDDDLALAVDADERAGTGGTGLALVARRCQTVWLVCARDRPRPPGAAPGGHPRERLARPDPRRDACRSSSASRRPEPSSRPSSARRDRGSACARACSPRRPRIPCSSRSAR